MEPVLCAPAGPAVRRGQEPQDDAAGGRQLQGCAAEREAARVHDRSTQGRSVSWAKEARRPPQSQP